MYAVGVIQVLVEANAGPCTRQQARERSLAGLQRLAP
jgi:hypothetical protein